ncbi:MFS transporter [Staphylococcus intermedius]|uniref:Putative metabolite transport protein n=1 Tax=Staphylococcus intermedius NCTC 11048 TaxID=1141106 RepID=A0A380G7J2_STAIN|nr:MFS transporter [Staphylococcus intermedius]PCF64520.1 MFS transporter [Staphylococcus intermedius]PCF80128.1 MFS transporter [Staphylococcus intermedius]PCF81479.1 MFS transporter [Staphylococcus intermedius]PCF86020.1 MFS transporter [Staphylococcus intermedius]PNZ52508.1 MFS transporter [Staphylococcus intermedius NCTC 11048]
MNHDKINQVPSRYWMKLVAIFTLGWLVIYAARTILNPLMGHIKTEFTLTNAQLGLIMSLFFIGYTATQIPSGIMGDKIGRKKILVPSFLIFGIFMVITGLMPSYLLLVIAWVIVGLAQGMFYGPQYALSSEAIPEKNITLGSALINSGMAFGTSIGYFVSSITVSEMGMSWRTPFFIIAVPIFIIAILMYRIIKERPRQQMYQEENIAPFKISSLFKNRNLNLAYIIIFCSIYGFFMIITWLPYYLESERGINGAQVAFVASLVPWAAIPGSLFFSWLSDKLGRRKPVLMIMLPLAFIFTASIVFFDNLIILYISLIGYGIVGKISTNPVLIAVVADNAPKSALGTSFSVYNFIGMTASILAPYITGFLTDVTGSMAIGFYLAAFLLLVGFTASLLLKEQRKTANAQSS